jgi:hypothetical protein
MSEWISVKDNRKPKVRRGDIMSEECILYVPSWTRNNGVTIGCYLHTLGKFRPTASQGYDDETTHWMPLPKPPKGNK